MHTRYARLMLMGLMLALISLPAFAQGGTSSITGTVIDTSGGAVPGATVTAKNDSTGATFVVVTGVNGGFNVASVPVGRYTVTVALAGFKTVALEGVDVSGGQPAIVNAKLEVGALSETVTVQSASEMVQTQSTTVTSRMDVNEIANLPLTSRSVLDFVINLPGVSTPGGSRSSQINGLDQSSLNITLDGINVQDNNNKTGDGFFAIVNPRLDAIEEVTVSGAGQGADSSGSGAVEIAFVTRSGANAYTGSIYHYYRNDALNANNYFNIRDKVDKIDLLQNQPGGRVGGPIVIPGLFDGHNRAFFFVNYEEFRQPSQVTRTRTLLAPGAQMGLFTYEVAGGTRTVDLLALAAAGGHVSTLDPLMAKLLSDIRQSTTTTGSIVEHSDPTLDQFRYNVSVRSLNRFPTVRVDWNLSENHRLSGAANWQYFQFFPDTLNSVEPGFPGFPVQGGQSSKRIGISTTLRSTLGANIVNELRVGGSGAPVSFFPELQAPLWSSGGFGDMGGFNHDIDSANISNPALRSGASGRNAYTWLIKDTVNWQKGTHGLNLGFEAGEVYIWNKAQTAVSTLSYDVIAGTPADSMWTSANFPGSSNTDRGNAEDLYAVLVGSISAINGDARINNDTGEYTYLGASNQEGKLADYAFWFQDAWRPRPDLTINMGLRWEFQTPFSPRNNSYSSTTLEDVWGLSGLKPGCEVANITPETCNIYDPTAQGGKPVTEYFLYKQGDQLYNMDWNNLAPNVGVAWTPSAETGWLGGFLGAPGDTVFRAGWARSYQRNGMGDFTGRLDDNPGLLIQDVDRNDGRGNLLNGADVLLLRTPELLGPAPFPRTRNYPLTDSNTEDVEWFDPNLQVAWAETWSAGYQRALTRNMAMEVRYVGSRGRDLWFGHNLNSTAGMNVISNGLLDEFRLAQQNLAANVAAGRGATFAYMGPNTGTSPLPIALAYFNGQPASQAGNPARYTSSQFRDSGDFFGFLSLQEPNLFDYADTLDSQAARRNNALAAGLPANFLIPNPNKLGGAGVTGNLGFTDYHSLQVELRRRMSNGLQFQMSYVFGRGYRDNFYSYRVPVLRSLDDGGEGSVTHAYKANWVFELPFGQGRRFGTNVGPVLDRIIGGWQIHGLTRIQSGEIVDFGNVDVVGMSVDELKGLYGVYVDGVKGGSLSNYTEGIITFLPDDVILNTRRAFNTSPGSPTGYSALGVPEGRYIAPAGDPDCIETVANTYGDCGTRVLQFDGPMFKNVDLSIVKVVPIAGRIRAEVRFEMLNAFNWVNFNPFATTSTNATAHQATGFIGTSARIVQIVSRVTW